MLNIKGLNVNYGGIHALRDVDIEVPKNKIVTLIGANGAGKSSTLRSIMGIVKSEGIIEYNGKNIQSLKTQNIVKEGLVLVPEGRRVFQDLTVEENLILGAYTRKDRKEIKVLFCF